jgi:hypothetical protein
MKGNLAINASKNFLYYVGFEVLIAVVMKVVTFCDIAPPATRWFHARLIFYETFLHIFTTLRYISLMMTTFFLYLWKFTFISGFMLQTGR